MRVLHLTTDARIGGAERLLIATARHGRRFGCEHLFCTLSARGAFHDAVEEAGGTALALDAATSRQAPRAVAGLLRVLRDRRVDVLHTHLFHAGVLAWMASTWTRLPVRVHTRHYGDYLHRFGRWWEIGLDRLATRRAERVAAISHVVQDVLIEIEAMPRARVVVVHNGLDVPACARSSAPAARDPVLVSVGTLHARKGHEHLVRAMRTVRARRPAVRLDIYGEGQERPRLEALIRELDLTSTVRLCGYVGNLTESLAGADLLVHPSLEEGFGLALLEGMAQECAVVATSVGGIPEVVDDGVTGTLVAPADPHSLAGAILSLLDDPERRARMGRAGRQRVLERFTIDLMLKGYADLYAGLCHAPGHGR